MNVHSHAHFPVIVKKILRLRTVLLRRNDRVQQGAVRLPLRSPDGGSWLSRECARRLAFLSPTLSTPPCVTTRYTFAGGPLPRFDRCTLRRACARGRRWRSLQTIRLPIIFPPRKWGRRIGSAIAFACRSREGTGAALILQRKPSADIAEELLHRGKPDANLLERSPRGFLLGSQRFFNRNSGFSQLLVSASLLLDICVRATSMPRHSTTTITTVIRVSTKAPIRMPAYSIVILSHSFSSSASAPNVAAAAAIVCGVSVSAKGTRS